MGANGTGIYSRKAIQPTWKTKYLLWGAGCEGWAGRGGGFAGEG